MRFFVGKNNIIKASPNSVLSHGVNILPIVY